ncbi:MAG: FMN-binding protein [Planctomycetota bacterium]|jgi:electron transport complex protein RnfG
MKNGYLRQAWLVLALAAVFGACLAGVEAGLKGRIEANKRNETFDQIPVLVPGADQAATQEWETSEEDKDKRKVAYKALREKEHLGWVIKGAGQGFAGKIELLVGLDVEAETITGLFVLAQTETPALGERIKEDWFRGQFAGLRTSNDVTVTKASPMVEHKAANKIAAVTGATISSQAVTDIVNKAVSEFRDRMDELKRKE